MPATLPTARGAEVREAYVRTFDAIQLRVTFTIDELVMASDAVAYSKRTTRSPSATLMSKREAPGLLIHV
jgi:hypothetical protein